MNVGFPSTVGIINVDFQPFTPPQLLGASYGAEHSKFSASHPWWHGQVHPPNGDHHYQGVGSQSIRTSGLGNEADGGLVGKSFKGPTHVTKDISSSYPIHPPRFNTSPLKNDGNGKRSGVLLGPGIFSGAS